MDNLDPASNAAIDAVRSDAPRYEPIRALYAGPRRFRELAVLLAPLGGSRLVFPRILADALDASADRHGPAVVNQHARWFFGRSLVVWTDPRDLTWRLHDAVHDGRRDLRLSAWFLDGADWTHAITPVQRLAEHGETLQLVRFGPRYTEMPAFKRLLRRAQENRPASRYGARLDSEAKVHDYFRYFLQLIDSIRENGFQAQRGLARARLPSGIGVRGRHAFHQREIGAAVDANGRLLRFLGGRHRTAIAQALAIPAVPVEIRFVHAGWLAGEVARSGLGPAQALQAWAKRISLPAPGDS